MYCVSCLSLKMVASAKICSSRYSRSESTRGDVHECSWVFGKAVPGSADFGSSVEIADRVLHSASSASQSSFPAGLPELPEPPCINWLDSIKKLFVSWSGSNEKSASQQRPPGGVALAIAMRQATILRRFLSQTYTRPAGIDPKKPSSYRSTGLWSTDEF